MHFPADTQAGTLTALTDGDTVMDGGWDEWIVLARRRDELNFLNEKEHSSCSLKDSQLTQDDRLLLKLNFGGYYG